MYLCQTGTGAGGVFRLPPDLNGEKHGTVAVIVGGTPYEITTYRVDGQYHDSRHPDAVQFVPQVQPDLARRDFTINAMAYAPARD